MSSVRLAPSAAHASRRVAVILFAGAMVYVVLRLVLGAPSSQRGPRHGPREPYGPTVRFGLVQFVGQGAILAAGVYAGRRWGRIRL